MSELHAHGRTRGNSLFWRTYMLSWTVLAGGALAYLSVFAMNPEGRNLLRNAPPQSNQESNRAELDRAQLSAQVRSLNETVASLQSDLARIKNNNSSTPKVISVRPVSTTPVTQRQLALQSTQSNAPQPSPLSDSNQITTASISPPGQAPRTEDNKPTPVTPASAETQQTAASTAPQQRAKGPNRATTPLKPGGLPPLPKSRPQRAALSTPLPGTDQKLVLLNGTQTANPISTGSLPTPAKPEPAQAESAKPAPATPAKPVVTAAPIAQPPVFGQPTVKPKKVVAPAAALSLSTATSVTGLRASWLLLTTRHRNSFIGYTPRYVADTATGTYQLLAGPIANRVEADRLCTELRQESVNCGVSDYIGTPL